MRRVVLSVLAVLALLVATGLTLSGPAPDGTAAAANLSATADERCGPRFGEARDPETGVARPAIEDPITCPIVQGDIRAQVEFRAEGCGLTAPLYGTFAPGPGPRPGQSTSQPDIVYVVDQDGPLWAVDRRTGAKRLFIHTRTQRPLVPLGAFGPGTYDERGFLGVAFHPDYQVPGSPGFGKLYTFTSEEPGTLTQDTHNHHNVVVEWQAADPVTRPPVHPCLGRTVEQEGEQVPVEETEAPLATPVRELLRAEWPQFNHNGGAIFFGTRDEERRTLYVTTGDGGCADDQNLQTGFQLTPPCTGHGPGSEATAPNRAGNGQTRDVVWGKILQIPEPEASPTVVVTEDSRLVPPAMVRALGLRNPWRASSDRADLGGSGDIWLSDVGQNDVEEVDHLAHADTTRPTLAGQTGPAGTANFGWHVKEGTFLFDPFFYVLFNPPSDGFPFAQSPGQPADMRDPMGQYDHDEGTGVIGGFVYRGPNPGLQDLRGRYVFGDWSRRFLNGNGQIFFLDESDTRGEDDDRDHTPRVFHLTDGPLPGDTFVFGFGEDARGNLYALGNETGIPFKEQGLFGEIVRRCADSSFRNGEPHSPDCRD